MKPSKIKFPPTSPLQMGYGKKRLYMDLLRCAIGISTVGFVLFGLQAVWWLNIIFAMIGVAFTLYLWQVFKRTAKIMTVDKSGMMIGAKHIAWDELQRLKLRHFGGSKHSIILGSSFFELTLIGAGSVLRCDSGISHFKELLVLLLQASGQYDIEIDDDSVHNLAYLTKEEPQ